jgi:hypothetical protein
MKIDGRCHCGFITFEAEVDPEKVVVCHCTDCQTLSGSAFRTVALTRENTFKLLSVSRRSTSRPVTAVPSGSNRFAPNAERLSIPGPLAMARRFMVCAWAPCGNELSLCRKDSSGSDRRNPGSPILIRFARSKRSLLLTEKAAWREGFLRAFRSGWWRVWSQAREKT